jgi:hypothetical protein
MTVAQTAPPRAPVRPPEHTPNGAKKIARRWGVWQRLTLANEPRKVSLPAVDIRRPPNER